MRLDLSSRRVKILSQFTFNVLVEWLLRHRRGGCRDLYYCSHNFVQIYLSKGRWCLFKLTHFSFSANIYLLITTLVQQGAIPALLRQDWLWISRNKTCNILVNKLQSAMPRNAHSKQWISILEDSLSSKFIVWCDCRWEIQSDSDR